MLFLCPLLAKSSSDHMSGNQTGFVWLRVMGKVFVHGGEGEAG